MKKGKAPALIEEAHHAILLPKRPEWTSVSGKLASGFTELGRVAEHDQATRTSRAVRAAAGSAGKARSSIRGCRADVGGIAGRIGTSECCDLEVATCFIASPERTLGGV
jgi:hypothetical protein